VKLATNREYEWGSEGQISQDRNTRSKLFYKIEMALGG
jgi:hypothetical protein